MRFNQIFPELLTRDFSPGEAAKLSGIAPETQRLWRSRGLLKASAPYGWQDVIAMALMADLSANGVPLDVASVVSTHGNVDDLHFQDFRRSRRGEKELFVLVRTDPEVVPTTWSGDTPALKPEWLGSFGFWFSYSAVQRRVADAYESIRKPH